jgi:hypothetical protein
MRLKLISCDIFKHEVEAAQARSRNQIETEYLANVPHHLSDSDMVHALQAVVDRSDRARYHAVLLVSGSCKHGLGGLEAKTVPLVLPRAKDCISLLLERSAPKLPSGSGPQREPSLASPQSSVRLAATGVAPSTRWRMSDAQNSTAPGLSPLAKLDPWRWRGCLRPSPGPCHSQFGRGQLSVLEMLVDGYWNYTDFLVLAPGWRLVVDHEGGALSAEEMIP